MVEPWGPVEAEEYARRQEATLGEVVLSAIHTVLDEIRTAIMSNPGVPDMGAWSGQSASWIAFLDDQLTAAMERIIGHVLSLGDYRSSTLDYAQTHMQTVRDRLVDWPQEAFDEVREELTLGIAAGDDSRALRERVGDALDITALTRATETEMEILYDRIADGVTPQREAELRERIRELAETSDVSRRRWEWRADRIARTEVAGAVNAGVEAYAAESTQATGRQWWRRWWSSLDTRVRPSHRAAHSQVVAPGERFLVGGDMLRYPGDPTGSAGEVINCRCSVLLITADEAAASGRTTESEPS